MSDGGSSSSSSATTTNTTDKRMVVDTGVGISSESSNVTVNALDGGAIKAAMDAVKGNDAMMGEGYKALIETTQDINTSSSNGFRQLLGLAGKLFDTGSTLITKTQDATLAQIGQINASANDKSGSVDQKTIMVLGISAAVAAAAIFSKKG